MCVSFKGSHWTAFRQSLQRRQDGVFRFTSRDLNLRFWHLQQHIKLQNWSQTILRWLDVLVQYSVKTDCNNRSQIYCEFISLQSRLKRTTFTYNTSFNYQNMVLFICLKNCGPNIPYLRGLLMPVCTILLVWLDSMFCLLRLKDLSDCVCLL